MTNIKTYGWGKVSFGIAGLLMCAVLWQGCSTPAEHFADADKEVRGILEERQEQIFGEQKLTGIETPYSGRKLEDIPPSEIILNRITDGINLITLP